MFDIVSILLVTAYFLYADLSILYIFWKLHEIAN